MKTLIYGAGTLGCLYAHRLFTAGKDATILARDKQRAFIKTEFVELAPTATAARPSSGWSLEDALPHEAQGRPDEAASWRAQLP